MPKRSRDHQETIDINIEKIKNIIKKKREIYDKYVTNTKMHNLVIEKVNEKLATDVLPNDVNHFTNILRNRYDECYKLLHESSDKIKELTKNHYDLLEKNAKIRENNTN
jgi:hypothetical protein